MKIFSLNVGVENFYFVLKQRCVKNDIPVLLSVSFTLHGEFEKAARSDRIDDTVDYDRLSAIIKHDLESLTCAHPNTIQEILRETIKNYSPLITGGFISFSLQCHHSLTMQERI